MKKYFLVLMVLALAGADGFAQDEPASDTVWTKVISNRVNAVEFSPDGQFIYVAANDRYPLKVETATGEIIEEYEEFDFATVNDIDLSKDGKLLAATGGPDIVAVIDVENGSAIKFFEIPGDITDEYQFQITNSVSISRTNNKVGLIIRGDKSDEEILGHILVWDIESGELEKVISDKWAEAILFSPSENKMAVSHGDINSENNINIYNSDTWDKLGSLEWHNSEITDITFSEKGNTLISCSRSDNIKIWDMAKLELKDFIPVHDNAYSVCVIDNFNIASSGKSFPFIESEIKVTNLISKETIKQFSMISGVDLDAKNNFLAVAYSTNLILLYINGYLSATEEIDFEEKLQIIPNPVTSLSEIKFNLPEPGLVNIKILNSLGVEIEEIFNGFLDIGSQYIPWNPKNLANGSYLCSIQCGDYEANVKLILQR